jgi:tetratricopeptide (TPR) repeat protein
VSAYQRRDSGPRVPDEITAQQLDPEARAQLNSLPNDLADSVARYLVAAGMTEDPEQGYAYAQAARHLAARIGVVREASAIAAYRTGRWAEALAEFRAARRMTGRDDYLPVMADSERALGRLDRALALVREADVGSIDRATQIELRLVESGIRRDQGLADAAVLALQVPELTGGRLHPWSARLFYAYADALLAAGRADEARDAFARAAAADADGETDAADRLDELDGIQFEDLAESGNGEEAAESDDLEDLADGLTPDADGLADDRRNSGLPAGRYRWRGAANPTTINPFVLPFAQEFDVAGTRRPVAVYQSRAIREDDCTGDWQLPGTGTGTHRNYRGCDRRVA